MTPSGQSRLILDEGIKLKLYDDATGLDVIKLPSGGFPTIGIGRNLSGRGLTTDEVMYLFSNDIVEAEHRLANTVLGFINFPPIWQDVVVMVDFNTGNVLSFKHMLAAMKSGDAKTASSNCNVTNKVLATRYTRMAQAILNNHW